MENNSLIIRSSSAEFLIFERQKKEKGVEVRFEKGDLWLTQRAISELYDCSIDNVSLHLKNIYKSLELDKNSTIEEFSVVQKEGKREVSQLCPRLPGWNEGYIYQGLQPLLGRFHLPSQNGRRGGKGRLVQGFHHSGA